MHGSINLNLNQALIILPDYTSAMPDSCGFLRFNYLLVVILVAGYLTVCFVLMLTICKLDLAKFLVA
jgi:hypothetical protein